MTQTTTIYGIHAVLALLKHQPSNLVQLHCSDQRDDSRIRDILNTAEQLGFTPRIEKNETLTKLSQGGLHQGVVAQCKLPAALKDDDLRQCVTQETGDMLFLLLDSVQDPHNLGACLRSADAAGVHGVIIPQDRSAKLSATVMKVASGAALSVPLFQVTNLARSMRLLKEQGVWIVGSDGEADALIYDVDLKGRLALVMGAEGRGLRELIKKECDFLARLPMHGMVESLNVSVASGICLYEALRQRRMND